MGNVICKSLCKRAAEYGDALDEKIKKATLAEPAKEEKKIVTTESGQDSAKRDFVIQRTEAPSDQMRVIDAMLRLAISSLPPVGAMVKREKAKQVYAASQFVADAVKHSSTQQKKATWAACDKIWDVVQNMKVFDLDEAVMSLPEPGSTVSREKARKFYDASQMAAEMVISAPLSEKAATWAACDKIWEVVQTLRIG